MSKKLPSLIECPNCEGCGMVENPIWRGREMRGQRVDAGKTLTEVAALLEFSKGYISDLELGRRDWNDTLVKKYERALKK